MEKKKKTQQIYLIKDLVVLVFFFLNDSAELNCVLKS